MFEDSLQKKLRGMEKRESSHSLESVKPTFKERAGFLGRYFSKAVKGVPQDDVSYWAGQTLDYISSENYIGAYNSLLRLMRLEDEKRNVHLTGLHNLPEVHYGQYLYLLDKINPLVTGFDSLAWTLGLIVTSGDILELSNKINFPVPEELIKSARKR